MFRAIIRSFLTLIGFSLLALSFLGSGDLTSLLISGSVFLLGACASYYVFRLIKSRPFGEINNYSSPDLDNLVPTKGSGVSEVRKEKLTELFQSGKWKPNIGVLKIWGDWKQKHLDTPKIIQNITSSENETKLNIIFDQGKVQIINPRNIYITQTYLKIMYADKILWNWEGEAALIYELKGKEINRSSNIDLDLSEFDIDSTQPALMFY